MWLLDTTFVIDLFMGGLFCLGNKEKIIEGERALARFDLIPYTYEIARKAAKIDAELIKQGGMLSFPDVVIAATAIVYDLKLVTRDKHFERIEGLQIEVY